MTTWSEYTADQYDHYLHHSAYTEVRPAQNSLGYESRYTNRLVAHTSRKYKMISEAPHHSRTYENLVHERLGSDYTRHIRLDATTVYRRDKTVHYNRQEQQFNQGQ